MPAAEPDTAETNFGAAELKDLFNGLAGTPAVAIAVSGGSDSTALLHLVREWRSNEGAHVRLVSLTVDHGLRAGSAQEAAKVAADCARWGIAHHTLHWMGEKPQTGIQAKAREARYDLLTRWCRAHGFAVLLTAHTADDQAETVLMRSRRTQTPASLAGIWPERDWNGTKVMRPLLSVRRQALRQFLAMRGIGWSEDPSNTNERFERVRVRRILATANVPGLALQALEAQRVARELGQRGQRWIAGNARAGQAGDITFPADALAACPVPERLEVISAVIRSLRGTVSAERAELLLLSHWLGSGAAGRRTLNGVMFQVRQNRGRLEVLCGREPGRIAQRWDDVPDSGDGTGQLEWDHRYLVAAPAGSRIGPARLAPDVPRLDRVPFWLHEGLPVIALRSGACFLGISVKSDRHLELLGITVRATYVNRLEGLPVA